MKILADFVSAINPAEDWSSSSIERIVRSISERSDVSILKIVTALRSATGLSEKEPIFSLLENNGREKTIDQINRHIGKSSHW